MITTTRLVGLLLGAATFVLTQQTLAQPAPDLAILSAPICTPNTVTAGQSITVSFQVANQGAADASPTQARVQVLTAGNGELLTTTVATPALTSGGQVSLDASLIVPIATPSGQYTVVVTADTNFQLFEETISNNSSPPGPFYVEGVPVESDVVLDGNILITPDPVPAGDEIMVRYRIKNLGPADVQVPFKTRVLVKNPTEFQFILLDFPVAPLAAGQTSAQEHRIKLGGDLRSGIYTVRIRLDPFLDIQNQKNTFNDASDPFPFEVISVLPDLQVTFAEVCPHSVHAGDPARLNFTLFNDSSSPAPAARNRIELTDPKTNQKVFSEYLTNGIISAHGSADYSFPFTIPSTGVPGRWGIGLFVNDFVDFPESDTFNNVKDPVVTLTVVGEGTVAEPCPEPLRLNSPRIVAGHFTFEVVGSGNELVTIQSSSDLKTWNTVDQVMLVMGTASFTAPDGSSGYFRAIKNP